MNASIPVATHPTAPTFTSAEVWTTGSARLDKVLHANSAGPKPLPHTLAPSHPEGHSNAEVLKKLLRNEFKHAQANICSKRYARVASPPAAQSYRASRRAHGELKCSGTTDAEPPPTNRRTARVAAQRKRLRYPTHRASHRVPHRAGNIAFQVEATAKCVRTNKAQPTDVAPKLPGCSPPSARGSWEGTPDALEAKSPPSSPRGLEGQPGESTPATSQDIDPPNRGSSVTKPRRAPSHRAHFREHGGVDSEVRAISPWQTRTSPL